MKVYDLFRQLALGELSNLSMSDTPNGTIKEGEQAKLILHTNEALLRLYSRFILKEKQVLILQATHITNYHLRSEYAESSESDKPYKYIKDMRNDPFDDDAIKIINVLDGSGRKRPLNDVENPASLFTPYPTTLQVPNPIEGQPLGVIYQARHSELEDTGNGLLNQEIDIPFALEGALKNYIAHKIFDNIGGTENTLKGQNYLSAYESICVEIKSDDLINQTFHTTHHKLEDRGFV